MIRLLRTFLVVMEERSLNRAAQRMGVAQPTLSRQIQSLEQELGAPLFERGSWGLRPTDLGFRFKESMLPVVRAYDEAWANVTATAKGRSSQLRIGYIGSTANSFLNPALAKLRDAFPETKLWLFDQTPAEQLEALREGRLDIALIGQEGAALADDFYKRRAAKLRVCVALADDHPLARKERVSLAELAGESFIGVADTAVPGRNEWVRKLCRRAGFKPRFVAQTDDISETYSRIVAEGAIALLPEYSAGTSPPGVLKVPISDKGATWDFYVLRQRGKGSKAGRYLVELLIERPPATDEA